MNYLQGFPHTQKAKQNQLPFAPGHYGPIQTMEKLLPSSFEHLKCEGIGSGFAFRPFSVLELYGLRLSKEKENIKKTIMKAFFLGTLISSFGAQAATTGQLLLQGVVPAILAISVSPQPIATALDLTSTQTDLLIGSVSEQSNSNTGYKITVSSLNDGSLLRSGGSETFNYTFKYDGQSINLVGSSNTPVTAKTEGTGGSYNTSSDVTVSYTGVAAASMVAGTYQDTLTLEISAN